MAVAVVMVGMVVGRGGDMYLVFFFFRRGVLFACALRPFLRASLPWYVRGKQGGGAFEGCCLILPARFFFFALLRLACFAFVLLVFVR